MAIPASNSVYWKQRFEQIEAAANRSAVETFETVQKQYLAAEREIEQQISTWYQRFAKNNQISMAEARKLLTTKELVEFKWDVKEFIKYGEENELNQQWMKELENASARFHVSRLEALKVQTQQTVEKLFGNQTDSIDRLLKKNYLEGYYHTAYEVHKGFNIGWDIAAVDDNTVERLISKPWATDGKNFSDRIWSNKTNLINEVQTQLTRTFMLGRSPDEAIKAIADKMKTSKNQAGRLVMTESAFFSSQSQGDAFNQLDVEQYEIVATLDSRTSEICQELDGQVFDMKDFQPGVTAPPFHVWCRTTTVPHFDDNYTERAARGADGKTYYVPGDMKYPDWKKTFVDGGSKKGLEKTVDMTPVINGIMGSKQIQLFDDVHKQLIESDLKKAAPENVQVVQKSIENLNLNLNGTGTCFYRPGSSYMEMNMGKEPAENVRTFWHEYGHYIDDVKVGNGLKLTTDAYPGSTYTFDVFGVSSRANFKHNYLAEGVSDLQNFLDHVAPNKYDVLGDKYGSIYLKGTQTLVGADWGVKSDDFINLLDDINVGLKKDLGVDDADKFLKSLGYPAKPQYDDFFEWYRTPKRQTLKNRPRYKGAEDAWSKANQEFGEVLNIWEKAHPNAYEEVSKIRAIYESKKERIGAVTDLLDGLAHGEMGMNISWGGHSGRYFKEGDKPINEGFANWFQMMFQNDTEMLNYLEKYAPNAKSIFEQSFAELVKQTLGGD